MIEIIPTVVPASLEDIARAAQMYAPFAKTLHVDFADGIFAPNTTWIPTSGDQFPLETGLAFEAHLMVAHPQKLGELCIEAGASRVIGHVEAMRGTTPQVFDAWRKRGAAECGLGTLFDTPVESLAAYVPLSDFIMFMGITAIGVQGLPADPNTSAHAATLRARYPGARIEVDGAISQKNIAAIAKGGARRFCAGSALSTSADPEGTYRELLALAESGARPAL